MDTMGYILKLSNKPQTYTGYRSATPDMDVHDGEQYVDTLEGWTFYQPQYVTKQDVYHGFKLYLANLPDDKALLLEPYIGTLTRRFNEWIDDALPTSEAMLKDTCEYIKGMPNIDETLDADLDRLIASIDTVGQEKD
jgi:hypothetical protein